MRKAWKFVGIAALVVVLGLGTVAAVAFAQGPTSRTDGPFNYFERLRQTLAGILGISVEQYDSAVVQAQDQVLSDAVTEGWLTQDQADQMRDRMAQGPGAMPWGMGKGFGGHGRGGMGGMGGWGVNLVSVAADTLGMSQSDLMTALRDGKSIADVAKEKGVDPQTIADAYIARLQEKMNQSVTDGRLTQKMADSLLEQARGQVTDQLNGTWENLGPGGFHGRGWDVPPCIAPSGADS